MSADIDKLILEHLRSMRGGISEIKERMSRVELRLSAMEQTLGSLYALSGSDRETLERVVRRVERIEPWLNLTNETIT